MSLRLTRFAPGSAAVALALLLGLALGEGGSLSAQTPAATAPTFPMQLIAGEGTGPALFLGNGATAAGVGFISPGVPIELVEAPQGDRVLVRVRGGMRVRAYLPTSRLAAIVQRRGRIRGTPMYVGPGSIVRVVGFDPDGRARIAAAVTLGGRTLRYEGTFPTVGLGAARPEITRETDVPGETQVFNSTSPITVYDAPNGAVVETIPAGDYVVHVVETTNGFHSVILGAENGPYLAGFVPVTQGRLSSMLGGGRREPGPATDAVPRRLRADSQLPLVQLAAGTRVTFEGETVAQLDRPGYARIVERHTDSSEADVFVAVDDDLAVRGMVDLTSLGAPVP